MSNIAPNATAPLISDPETLQSDVPVVESITEVDAPVATVWDVLTNPAYTPKIYPDILFSTAEPSGPSVVGQKVHLVGKVGRRKLELFAEVMEVVKEKKLVTVNKPGRIFRSYKSIFLLEPRAKGTIVRAKFDYELNLGGLGKVFNVIVLERLMKDNMKGFSKNLKEICELIPVSD